MANEKDLVHSTWHHVDRVGAEKLLAQENAGTYFFRKDDFATILEQQLNQEKTEDKVVCYTLSFLDAPKHVVDRTIVYKDRHWYIYDDDPQLRGIFYNNIDEVLTHTGTHLDHPLYRQVS